MDNVKCKIDGAARAECKMDAVTCTTVICKLGSYFGTEQFLVVVYFIFLIL